MASLVLLVLSLVLLQAVQSVPVAHGGGRGLDVSVGGIRRERRDLRNLSPYEEQMMSYPATQRGGPGELYYQSSDWRGRGLDQALQRLVDRDQRQQQDEEQRAAYLSALLRLLSKAQSLGLVGPGDVELMEEQEDQEDQGQPGDFREDYDETGRGMRPPPRGWSLAEMDRMDPRLVQALLERVRQDRRQEEGRGLTKDQDTLRRLVASILSSIGPNSAAVNSARRVRRDLSVEPISSAHRRTRRSLDDAPPPLPSNGPPLLRVKRLEEEEEEELRPPGAGLQRMKRVDAGEEELNPGSRRRQRRSTVNYDPQMLITQFLEYMRE